MPQNKISAFILIIAMLVLATVACNLPAYQLSQPVPVTEATAAPLLPLQEATSSTAEGNLPVETPLPTADVVIQTNLPVVVMEPGSGYIFSTGQLTHDDRDIWWNNTEIVPANTVRMMSLGVISSPADINELAFPAETPIQLIPVLGEGFGLEITRAGGVTYAVIRIVGIDSSLNLSFDYIYPFAGIVH